MNTPVQISADARGSVRSMLSKLWRALAMLALLGTGVGSLFAMWGLKTHRFLFDFRGGLYNAGLAILHGMSPYQPHFLAAQVAIMRAGGMAIGETTSHAFSIPVYPAPINLAVVPFSLLPFWVAGILFTALSIAAMVLGLRLLGVRDWRCFVVALLSWPMLFSLDLGALGPLLVLGAGAAWHWRDRVWPPAIALASIVATKLFPWPLGVWLLVTKRYRALAMAIAIGLVVTLGAWAVIGFDGITAYPRMLSELSTIQQGRAASLVAVLLALGVSAGLASAAAYATAGGLLLLAWRVAHHGGNDRQAYGITVIAALTASPIVWEHYMVLLFIPIALMSPRLSPMWFVPCCSQLILIVMDAVAPIPASAAGTSHATIRAAVVWLLLEAFVAWRLCRVGTVPQHSRARSAVSAPAAHLAAATP
jgi:hypothetical protein